jgi:hypothetical protein
MLAHCVHMIDARRDSCEHPEMLRRAEGRNEPIILVWSSIDGAVSYNLSYGIERPKETIFWDDAQTQALALFDGVRP